MCSLDQATAKSMMPKSAERFSDDIMLYFFDSAGRAAA
jgi:hypothetical protein